MGRTLAVIWHASFSLVASALYFFFVLPRWWELTGVTSPVLGTVLRIVAGVLIAVAALPVVFTQLRTRKPEYGVPQLALTIRWWSIAAHMLAGVLIAGTAISEIWLDIDSVGQWLFGIYGAAAAIALIGVFGFYISFVAELPPPPPKPLKPKKSKQPKQSNQRISRKKRAGVGEQASAEPAAGDTQSEDAEATKAEAAEAPEAEAAEAEAAEAPEAEAAEAPEAEAAEAEDTEAEGTEAGDADTSEAEGAEELPEASAETLELESTAKEPEPPVEAPRGGLANRRPTGKSRRRVRTRGVVQTED